MKVYNLDEKNEPPHHYIIAVAVHPATAGERAGKMFLKYRPLYFSCEDIIKLKKAAMLSQDKLFPTKKEKAAEILGVSSQMALFSVYKIAAQANMCSLHHFHSEFEITEDWFESLVNTANTSKSSKELLNSARIHY